MTSDFQSVSYRYIMHTVLYMWGIRFKGSYPWYIVRLQNLSERAWRDAPLLPAYTALAEDLSSVPAIHISRLRTPKNFTPRDPMSLASIGTNVLMQT